MTFREAVKELVKEIATRKYIRIGKAVNIDTDKCVCDIELGNDLFLYNVKLKAIEGSGDNGLVIIPKENTMVCAAMLEGVESNWTMLQYSEIDSWQIVTDSGGKVVVSNEGKVYLNGDDYKGLVKIEELVKRLNKIEEKHDALTDDLNNHTHTHAITGGTAETKPPTMPSTNKIGGQTQVSDLENDTVFHGKG